MSASEFVFNTGAAWTDLLGTRRRAYGSKPDDLLTTPERLGEWLEHQGLAPRGANGGTVTLEDRDLDQAVAAREALRRVANDALGMPPTSDAPDLVASVAVLNDCARRVQGPFGGAGGTLRHPETLTEAIGRLVIAASADLAEPSALRACADPDCAKIYRDASGSRRYCGPACATLQRVRAHRAKEAG
jgi:predicted RNA-binding Zn ribbon-like protein